MTTATRTPGRFAERAQRLKAADVRAKQQHAAAARHLRFEHIQAMRADVETLQRFGQQEDPVEHGLQ